MMTNLVQFPRLGLELEIDRVAFTLGGLNIYWYGIIIAAGLLLALVFAFHYAADFGVDADRLVDVVLVGTVCAIICARAYYVAFAPFKYDSIWDMINLRDGGIAIYGAVIGAAVFGGLACKWRKVPILPTFDLVAMGFLIGQGMGRWGNFFNQEAFGGLVTDPAWQYFPYAVYIERLGEWHQATFFYESVACFLIFIFLMVYRRKAKNAPVGNLFLWYWVLYGIERAYVEGLRTDSLWMFKGGIPIGSLIFFPNGLRVSQVLSIVMAVAFAIVLFVRFIKRRKNAPPVEKVEEPVGPLDPELVLIPEDRRETAEDDSAAEDSGAEDAAAAVMGAAIVNAALQADEDAKDESAAEGAEPSDEPGDDVDGGDAAEADDAADGGDAGAEDEH